MCPYGSDQYFFVAHVLFDEMNTAGGESGRMRRPAQALIAHARADPCVVCGNAKFNPDNYSRWLGEEELACSRVATRGEDRRLQ